ncbi:MAG TPA: sialidase family protein [Candidatus Sulfotelmatobacter sp.]|nr:sialidase family protein [Candidatus Sulfotelmatobacter sp.]
MTKPVFCSSSGLALFAIFAFTLALAACGGSSSTSTSTSTQTGNPVGPNLIQVSSDPFTVAPGQHATEVEPHLLSNGTTMVAAFQVGRIAPGGATDIGWATSTDGGVTWTQGSLPGLTKGEGSGPYDAASDPAVAFDAKHNMWMIASLPLSSTSQTPAVVVSRSTDGLNWGTPISVDPLAPSSDKNWIVCDSWPTSPHYGNCYTEWDDPFNNDEILMSTSTDGGLTWGVPTPTANSAAGIGGQPLVQPNGTVVVPIETGVMAAFLSSNGGASWTAPVTISSIQFHADAGGIRSGPLPSAAVDGGGTIWNVWEDCRFRSGCLTNDLVYSTSADGVTWSAVTRIPIDDTSSTVDHFIPGIGIDPATSGTSAHVALHYYYYPQSSCSAATCQLFVGYISSANSGSTWNTPATLTSAAMPLNWLANSQNGLMVGDYIATAFVNGVPHGVFAVAQKNNVGFGGSPTFKEAIYTAKGLSVTASARQLSSAHDKPLHNLSDKIEREVPEKGIIPPSQRRARRSAK